MAVRLDGDGDEIRIVEGTRAALESLVVELPVRRPQPPDELAELAPVLVEPGAAALGAEIVLIPEAVLLLRHVRRDRAGNVLDVVAIAGDEGAHALRPQCRDDAGGAATPVV